MSVESPIDANGPTFLYQELSLSSGTDASSSSSKAPYAVQYNSTLQMASAVCVSPPVLSAADQRALLASAADGEAGAGEVDVPTLAAPEPAPDSVQQVWVANRVAGSETWSLRSAGGTFLGADAMGGVYAAAEARGPQEGWRIEPVPLHASSASESADPPVQVAPGTPLRGMALRSAHGTYLTCDEIAGGKVALRADGESVSACVWQMRVQWKYRHESRRAYGGAEELTKSGFKKTYRGADDSSAAAARSAAKLLETRMKQKSDRYAK